MAERVFAGKLQRAGFADVWVGGHQPFGIDQAALYPLFTPEVIQVMRETIPPDHQDHVATGVIVKARRPGSRPTGDDWISDLVAPHDAHR
jgi:arsenite methyltransferase